MLSVPRIPIVARFSALSCSCGCSASAPLIILGSDISEEDKKRCEPRVSQILDKAATHSQLIMLHTNYRTAVPPHTRHWLYSMVVPLFGGMGGGIIANTFIHQKPISLFVDNTNLLLFLAYWGLVYHSPGDFFYKFFASNKTKLLKDVFSLLDGYSTAKSICAHTSMGLDKYPGAPLGGFVAGILSAVGGGATFGYLDAKTRNPSLKWILSNPSTGLKVASTAAAAFIGLSTLLPKLSRCPCSAEVRKQAARKVAGTVVMGILMGATGYSIYRSRKEAAKKQAK